MSNARNLADLLAPGETTLQTVAIETDRIILNGTDGSASNAGDDLLLDASAASTDVGERFTYEDGTDDASAVLNNLNTLAVTNNVTIGGAEETESVRFNSILADDTNGSEDTTLVIKTMDGGTNTTRLTVSSDDLLVSGAGGIVTISDVSTNDTQKNAIIKLDHYHNSEEDFMGIRMTSIDDNILDLGGGSSSYNAATKVRIYSAANDATTTGTETARFTAGKMLVGATASFGGANVGHAEFLEIGNAAVGIGRGDSDLGSCVRFFKVDGSNSGTIVGSINVASSSTAYNTSSDYRLKTSVSYDWDATTRLKQLKPARFKWISDGDSAEFVDGLIAHEVATVIPDAVSGAKDDTQDVSDVILNADGTIKTHGVTKEDWTKGKSDGTYANDTTWVASKAIIDPQQMDYSKVVTLLVKTIQELEARIATLESA